MIESIKHHPLPKVDKVPSQVIGEDKKGEQSQNESKKSAPVVNRKDRNSSEWEIICNVMERK